MACCRKWSDMPRAGDEECAQECPPRVDGPRRVFWPGAVYYTHHPSVHYPPYDDGAFYYIHPSAPVPRAYGNTCPCYHGGSSQRGPPGAANVLRNHAPSGR
jgi:hypothetical protein